MSAVYGKAPADAVERQSNLSVWHEHGQRLQSIFDAAPALIFVLDEEHRYVFVNRAWERSVGLTRQQALGRSLFELFPKDSALAMAEENRRLLATGTPHESESVVTLGDAQRTFIITKVAVADASGRRVAVCGFSVDITERKRSEDRLRLLSEIASTLVKRGDDVDGCMDEMCGRLAAELGADAYFHYRAEEKISRLRLANHGGMDAAAAKSIEYLDYGAAVCGTVAATQLAWVIPDTHREHDGRLDLVRALGIAAYACYPLLCNGTLFGTLSLGRKTGGPFAEQELELIKAVADLAAVALDRASRARELLEVDRCRKEFLAVLAHELRAPLAPIIAAADLLGRAPRDGRLVEEARGVIERQADNLSRLVEDLFDGARVSNGKMDLELRPVSVEQVVSCGVEISRPAIDARRHALTVSLPEHPVHVSGDRRRLAQVVANLLANSARYTPRGGRIAVEVGAEPLAVVISVRDDGIGIDPVVLPRLFNLFEQAPISRAAAEGGLGIGLTLVKALVELHGGSIQAHSAGPGKGSEFRVRLPRLPDPVASQA